MAELRELKAEAQRERQTIGVLQASIEEWSSGKVELLDSASNLLSEEDNEWKTRYESQAFCNEQLEKQLASMKEKVVEMKKKVKTLHSGGELQEFQGVDIKKLVMRLNREKNALQSQFRDYEWRLDQEARLFHKADEKRKAMLMDISRSNKKQLHEKSKNDSIAVSKALKKIKETSPKDLPYLQRRRASVQVGQYGPNSKPDNDNSGLRKTATRLPKLFE